MLMFGMLTVLTNIRPTKVVWLLEDNLWRKTTFGGRRPSLEDDFWWKTNYCGRRPLVGDDLRWETTFGGRQLLVEDDPCMLPSLLCGIFEFWAKCRGWSIWHNLRNEWRIAVRPHIAKSYFEICKSYDHMQKNRPLSPKFTEILRFKNLEITRFCYTLSPLFMCSKNHALRLRLYDQFQKYSFF